MEEKKFYIQFTVLTAVLAITVIVLQQFTDIVHPYTLYIQGYFIILTLGTYLLVNKGIKGHDMDFVSYFMGALTIRLLVSAIILFLYYYFIKEDAVLFTGYFFIFYLCYTVFEIQALLAKLRQNFDRDGKSDEASKKHEA